VNKEYKNLKTNFIAQNSIINLHREQPNTKFMKV
jgi:hypothetical protein